MMPFWPFQQYEAERARIAAKRRKAGSDLGRAAAAASLFGHVTRPMRAARRLFPAGTGPCA